MTAHLSTEHAATRLRPRDGARRQAAVSAEAAHRYGPKVAELCRAGTARVARMLQLFPSPCAFDADETGKKFSVNDAIVKAASLALRAVPEVNTVVSKGEPTRPGTVDISVAVATPTGAWQAGGRGRRDRRRQGARSTLTLQRHVLSFFNTGLITPIITNADARAVGDISSAIAVRCGRAPSRARVVSGSSPSQRCHPSPRSWPERRATENWRRTSIRAARSPSATSACLASATLRPSSTRRRRAFWPLAAPATSSGTGLR